MHIYIPIVGHVDNGKSSLLSRILFPDKNGDPYELDTLQEEKDRGITQEYSMHTKDNITFIDTAGHQSFIRSNIQAYTSYPISLAVIVCSVRRGEFESGFKKRSDVHLPSLKEQLILLKCCGVNSTIIVLTKTDLRDDLKVKDDVIVKPLIYFLKQIGVKNSTVISTSATTGEGIDVLLRTLSSLDIPEFKSPPIKQLNIPIHEFVCSFRLVFIPEGTLFTKGSHIMIHSGGEEVEGIVEVIKSNDVVMKPYTDYSCKFKLLTGLHIIGKRFICRVSHSTVGFCKNIGIPKKC